uniref:Arrestin-like N-terminal domain-containing protein n=1 Tax=Cyprinus carpio TaxID=7962 RepID=A0A8C1Z6P4_CYPCA
MTFDLQTKMSRSIKKLSLQYNQINESNTFSSGDIVEGRVVLEVTKEIKVNSLFVMLTGDAHVSWTEGSGDDKKTYSDHERYFKLNRCNSHSINTIYRTNSFQLPISYNIKGVI